MREYFKEDLILYLNIDLKILDLNTWLHTHTHTHTQGLWIPPPLFFCLYPREWMRFKGISLKVGRIILPLINVYLNHHYHHPLISFCCVDREEIRGALAVPESLSSGNCLRKRWTASLLSLGFERHQRFQLGHSNSQ